MKTTFKTATETLRDCGLTVLEMNTGKGGQIAFLPEFGRVIGIWTSPDESSLLWCNPDFPETVKNGSLQDFTIWANPGGDRLWLSPERDFFISDHNDPWGNYAVPRCMDPGDYAYIADNDTIKLDNAGAIKGFESVSETHFQVSRLFRSLDESELAKLCSSPAIESAGYEEKISLELTAGVPTPISFWNLSQVPKGGIVMMGINNAAPGIVEYIGEKGGCVGDPCNGLLPVRFDGSNQYKIGLTATDSSGFLAYLRCDTLLIRTFDIDSSANYIDVPPDGRPGEACPVQLYYGGDTYNFGELEYHSQALTSISDTPEIKGFSRLYAFQGPEIELMQVLDNFRATCIGTND